MDESAASISAKVGLGSSTYFFTLFKKTYGMTPAQYRIQSRLEGQLTSSASE